MAVIVKWSDGHEEWFKEATEVEQQSNRAFKLLDDNGEVVALVPDFHVRVVTYSSE